MEFGNAIRHIQSVMTAGKSPSSFSDLFTGRSANHNLNNVLVVFSQRLRLRLSNQKLAANSHERSRTLSNMPSWAGRKPFVERQQSIVSHRSALRSRWRQAATHRSTPLQPADSTHTSSSVRHSDLEKPISPILLSGSDGDGLNSRKRKFNRCHSHSAGRLSLRFNQRCGEKSWPRTVTQFLQRPEVLLEMPSAPLRGLLKMSKSQLSLSAGWAMSPHPDKIESGGADAFYISTDCACLAVADGVGEWDRLGFNARSFADQLMFAIAEVWENPNHAIHELHQNSKVLPSVIARELMYLAAGEPVSYGSSTLCVSIIIHKHD